MIDIDAALIILVEQRDTIMAKIRRLEEAKKEATAILSSTPQMQQARLQILEGHIADADYSTRLAGKSIANATEIVLREAGNRLHVGRIHELLAEGGKITTRQSIVSALLRDKTGRFKAHGKNTYGLTEWDTLNAIRASAVA